LTQGVKQVLTVYRYTVWTCTTEPSLWRYTTSA